MTREDATTRTVRKNLEAAMDTVVDAVEETDPAEAARLRRKRAAVETAAPARESRPKTILQRLAERRKGSPDKAAS